jgi:phosphoenolpyruvate carboxylase
LFAERVAMMKESHATVEAQTSAFRDACEAEFQEYGRAQLGGTDARKAELAEQSRAEMAEIQKQMEANRDAVVDDLFKAVASVSTEVPERQLRKGA